MPLSTSVSPKSSRCNGASAVLICFCRTRTLDRRVPSRVLVLQKKMSTALAPLHLLLFGETLVDNGIHSASWPPRERHTNPYALPVGKDRFIADQMDGRFDWVCG